MSLTSSQINVFYEELLARQATAAEQAAFVALSQTQSTANIEHAIETLPEVANLVDPVIRLYQGAFGRVPDTVGNFGGPGSSGFWVNVNALRNGISLQNLAEAFTVSAEFIAIYGTNAVTPALIQAYYHHILNRDGSTAEVNSWLNSGLDAAHILIGFTQSAEYIAASQPQLLAFKTAVLNGQHPAGGLPPAPPSYTLVSDHDFSGTANEGQSITYTLQGPASDAGKTYSYTLSGVTPGQDITGGLTGTVTLDALGLASIVVTTIADQKTDGPLPMTLTVAGLTDEVTILNTSLTPAIQNFTSTVGETLVGGPAATTFVGTVDTNIVGNNTLSNVVDVAQGNKLFHNIEKIIIDNTDGTALNPSSTGVQELQVVNLDKHGGTTQLNAQFMKDVNEITSTGSSHNLNIFNLQNFINTINVTQSDVGFNFLGVKMIDGTVGGAQTINTSQIHTLFLADETSNGTDIVTSFTVTVAGDDTNLTIDGTSVATSFTVSDTGTTDATVINFFNDGAGEGTEALTSLSSAGIAGSIVFNNVEVSDGHVLTFTEGSGTNTLNASVEGTGGLTINGNGGTDTANVTLTADDTTAAGGNGQVILVTEGNGNDTLNVTSPVSTTVGNNVTVTGTYGNGNDNLSVQVNDNANVSLTAGNGNDNVNVTVQDPSTVKVSLGNGSNNITVNNGEGANTTVTAGNGGNVVIINTTDAGASGDDGNDEGGQSYTVTLGTGANQLTITPGGSDPIFFAGFPDFGADDAGNAPSHSPNGEPDSVTASHQVINVAMGVGGTAAQLVNIETGANSQVAVTTGGGADNITINADNDVWQLDSSGDPNGVLLAPGASQIAVSTGDGNKVININTDNTGTDPVSSVPQDHGSNIAVTAGNGNDTVNVTTGSNGTVTVTVGNGNDNVQLFQDRTDHVTVNLGSGTDRVYSDFLTANMHFNGGGGFDTLASQSGQFNLPPTAYANINGFSAIEVTDVLVNDINLDAFAPQNDISLVILDSGYSGTPTISGLDTGDEVDLLAGGGTQLNLLVDNSVISTNDVLNLEFDANSNGLTNFGTLAIGPGAVETLNVESSSSAASHPLAVNQVNIQDTGITNLNISHDTDGGDVSLVLDGSNLGGGASLNVQAVGFTAAITDANMIGDVGENVTFNAPNSGSDSLIFGDGNDSITLGNGNNNATAGNGNDAISLGNGNNVVVIGSGTDSLTAGNGNNTVTVTNGTANVDTLTFGTGANVVNLNGAGGSGSSITFAAAHGANIDHVNFNNTAESSFTLPDVIHGFVQGQDVVNFAGIDSNPANYHYFEVSGAVAVTAAIAGATGGANQHDIVLDKTDGNVYIDWNGNHVLSTADPDMQITLTGVNHLSLVGTTLV
jgi:hypothetical protein